MAKKNKPDENFLRKHGQTFAFNAHEFDAFEKYCKKYKVANRAKFFRETIMAAVLKRFADDSTLF